METGFGQWFTAGGLAVTQVVLGWVVGSLAVLMAVAAGVEGPRDASSGIPLIYPVLVPLLWVEWSLISGMIRAGNVWLRPAGKADSRWRGGGAGSSFAADATGLFLVGGAGWIPG